MIGNLIRLQTLKLYGCKNLEFVPNSIYNLNCLKFLSLDGCLKLKKFPPPVSIGLCSLEVINLSYCSTLISSLICLTSLRDLDLSGTMIESIPSSIKQVSGLYSLRLTICKCLQSIPELPLMLFSVEAHACTSLKTVSSSRTPLTRGRDECRSLRPLMIRIFSNCLKLDQNAWGNIMADAHYTIIGMASALSHCREEENYVHLSLSLLSSN